MNSLSGKERKGGQYGGMGHGCVLVDKASTNQLVLPKLILWELRIIYRM